MLTRIRTFKRDCATAPSGMPLLGCICYRDHLQSRRSARSLPTLQAAGREQNSWGGMGVPINLNTEIILKDVRLYDITDRHIFATRYKAARFLKFGLLEPS